ncbi:VQ motif-containing protein 20-like [Macadamia integrifolia]|uniref:VQ motif-containing protein 20-like n=1 Tax=Macadamia integrifolia TaxID=60698 RepID=UPI001C4F2F2A|nr:VQ motif-containing protein 20-like [Macadamia integrifolia]
MSPGLFRDDQQAKKEMMNGPRPSPLKINKDSHPIQKPSSSSMSSVPPPFNGVAAVATKQQQNQQRHHPVIIYTHSPKIIHTHARDFMALVQKLTGLSRSDDDRSRPVQQPQLQLQEENGGGGGGGGGESSSSEAGYNNNNNKTRPSHEDNESSSVVTDENCGGGEIQVSSSSVSHSVYEPSPNPFFSADIPLFTPNSSADLFCSPRRLYRFPESLFTPSNRGSSISPSFLEVMKGFPGY